MVPGMIVFHAAKGDKAASHRTAPAKGSGKYHFPKGSPFCVLLKEVEVTPENIDDLFVQCETILAEGLKDEYWRRVHDKDEPDRAKLELFCVLRDPAPLRTLQEECGKRERLRLNQKSIRDKVLKVTDLKHLAQLYAQHG